MLSSPGASKVAYFFLLCCCKRTAAADAPSYCKKFFYKTHSIVNLIKILFTLWTTSVTTEHLP